MLIGEYQLPRTYRFRAWTIQRELGRSLQWRQLIPSGSTQPSLSPSCQRLSNASKGYASYNAESTLIFAENKKLLCHFRQDYCCPNTTDSKEYKCPISGYFKVDRSEGWLKQHISECRLCALNNLDPVQFLPHWGSQISFFRTEGLWGGLDGQIRYHQLMLRRAWSVYFYQRSSILRERRCMILNSSRKKWNERKF